MLCFTARATQAMKDRNGMPKHANKIEPATQSSIIYDRNCKCPCEPDSHMSQIHIPTQINTIDDLSFMIESNIFKDQFDLVGN